jgi:hypothetical protein
MPLTSQRLIYIHDCRLDQLNALLSPHPLHNQSSPLTVHVPLQCLTASLAELNYSMGVLWAVGPAVNAQTALSVFKVLAHLAAGARPLRVAAGRGWVHGGFSFAWR